MKKWMAAAAALAAAMSMNVVAEEAKNVLPDVMATYEANSENSYVTSYLEQDPYLVNIYEGFGFAKDYGSARGHAYTLEDVNKTERPHPLANCLTCKTADFTKLVNDLGVEAYSMEYDSVAPDMKESVGCYTCHEDQVADGTMVLTHDYTAAAIGDEMGDSIDPVVAVCGQCHTEYYFAPDTKATVVPYTDIETMNPEAMLAFYDEMDFADWTQESTGTRMLKAQHPEMETYLGEGSVHAGMGMSCADCHMATETNEAGDAYASHYWESPLQNEALLETCAACHKDTDMVEKVQTLQAEITARETEVGEKLSGLKDALAEANASGDYTEDELNAIRGLHRSAQWFFDFDYVENSEGAHNSTLAKKCLDKSEALIDEAMGLFKA
ncbi:MAG: ammonia-forming cytochrome c nitrite reductase subunit c552 [Lachnospiraceae bacterium]|nr:ammonia-forming cytochrome c nitrite reductase subunit c552 [Lachnospiraceae bacterium]